MKLSLAKVVFQAAGFEAIVAHREFRGLLANDGQVAFEVEGITHESDSIHKKLLAAFAFKMPLSSRRPCPCQEHFLFNRIPD